MIYRADPRELDPLRLAGTKLIVPDDEDKIRLNGKRIAGSFLLCLDETGHHESVVVIRSTGVPRYDRKIANAMREWVFRPFVVDGVASPVCGAYTFLYTQS
jgi:hypothetical protein